MTTEIEVTIVVEPAEVVIVDPASGGLAAVAAEAEAREEADAELQEQIDGIQASDVETVAGVAPVTGDVPAPGLKTALSLPANTAGDLTTLDGRLDTIEGTYATDAELAAEAVLARNADNLTGGTVADGRIAASIARLASPALTGSPTAPTQSAGDNSTKIATTAYADALIAAADAMVFKGVIDASANPNYPAADKGWTYRISVAGKIGGASGDVVQVGDILLCLVDGSAAGTQAAVGANWSIAQTNIDGAVIGPASAVDNRVALFDGATGKLIKDSGVLIDAIALLASPAFTGNPTAPTPALGDNDTSIATTAFVQPRFAAGTSATAAATPAKTVTIAGYTPTTGDVLALTLTNGNGVGTMTLAINGGSALPIAIAGNTVASSVDQVVAANGVMLLYYSGARWETGPHLSHSVMSQATAEAGSSTTVEWVTAQRIRQAVAAYAVNKAGDTMTGELVLSHTGQSKINLNKSDNAADVKSAKIVVNTSGDVLFDEYTDAGAFVRTDLRIYRGGTRVDIAGAAFFRGTSGSPEGAVTAPVGSRYVDLAATLGQVEWIKASGAGNTGWSLVGGYNWTPSSDLVTGRYYFAGSQDGAGTANTLGTTLRVMPFVIAKTTSLARLFAEFTVAGDAASVLRLGIYADTGAGYPGALVLDAGSISTGSGNAGTVATGGTPGVYEITINQSLAPGLYWFGGVVQGVTVTQPTIRTVARGPNLPLGFSAIPTAGQTAIGYGQSGVSGALPAFAAGQGIVGSAPRVGFRVT